MSLGCRVQVCLGLISWVCSVQVFLVEGCIGFNFSGLGYRTSMFLGLGFQVFVGIECFVRCGVYGLLGFGVRSTKPSAKTYLQAEPSKSKQAKQLTLSAAKCRGPERLLTPTPKLHYNQAQSSQDIKRGISSITVVLTSVFVVLIRKTMTRTRDNPIPGEGNLYGLILQP